MVDSFVGSNLFSGSSGGLITSLQQSFAPQNLGVLSQDNNTSTTIRRNDPFDIADNFSVARGIHAEFRSISSFNQQQTDAIGLARQTAATLGGATDLLRELQSLTVKVGNSGLSDQDRANLSAEFNFTPSKLGRLLDNAGLDGKNLLEQGAKDIEVPSGNPLVDLGVSASNLNETFQQIFEVTRLATTTEEFIPRNPQDVEVSINANVGISIQLDSDDIQLDDDAASNVSFNLSDLLAGSDDAVLSEDGILTFSVDAIPGITTAGNDDDDGPGNSNGNGNSNGRGRGHDDDDDGGAAVGATITIDLSGFLSGNLDELSSEDVREQLEFNGELSFSLGDLVTQSSDDDDSGRPGNGNANGLGNGNGNGNAHGHDDDDDDGGIVVSNTLNAELELTIGGIPGEGGTEFDRVVTINVADNEALNDTFRQVGSAIAQAEESAALINGQADEIASNLSFNIEVQGILEETLAKIVDFDLPTANAQLVAQQIGRQLATQQLSIANQDTQSVPSLLNQNNLFGQPKDDNPFGSQQSNLFGAPESGSIFSQPAEQEDNLFPVFGRGF